MLSITNLFKRIFIHLYQYINLIISSTIINSQEGTYKCFLTLKISVPFSGFLVISLFFKTLDGFISDFVEVVVSDLQNPSPSDNAIVRLEVPVRTKKNVQES